MKPILESFIEIDLVVLAYYRGQTDLQKDTQTDPQTHRRTQKQTDR